MSDSNIISVGGPILRNNSGCTKLCRLQSKLYQVVARDLKKKAGVIFFDRDPENF